MDSPTNKAPNPAFDTGPIAGLHAATLATPSRAADYIYRIAAMVAGIIFLATVF